MFHICAFAWMVCVSRPYRYSLLENSFAAWGRSPTKFLAPKIVWRIGRKISLGTRVKQVGAKSPAPASCDTQTQTQSDERAQFRK